MSASDDSSSSSSNSSSSSSSELIGMKTNIMGTGPSESWLIVSSELKQHGAFDDRYERRQACDCNTCQKKPGTSWGNSCEGVLSALLALYAHYSGSAQDSGWRWIAKSNPRGDHSHQWFPPQSSIATLNFAKKLPLTSGEAKKFITAMSDAVSGSSTGKTSSNTGKRKRSRRSSTLSKVNQLQVNQHVKSPRTSPRSSPQTSI